MMQSRDIADEALQTGDQGPIKLPVYESAMKSLYRKSTKTPKGMIGRKRTDPPQSKVTS